MTAPLPKWPVIEHFRDIIADDDGGIEQLYSYVVYDFGDDVIARAYFDDPDRVALMRTGAVPDAVLAYLQARFWQIDQLGEQGYETIWSA